MGAYELPPQALPTGPLSRWRRCRKPPLACRHLASCSTRNVQESKALTGSILSLRPSRARLIDLLSVFETMIQKKKKKVQLAPRLKVIEEDDAWAPFFIKRTVQQILMMPVMIQPLQAQLRSELTALLTLHKIDGSGDGRTFKRNVSQEMRGPIWIKLDFIVLHPHRSHFLTSVSIFFKKWHRSCAFA